ncbi:hypothetical protein GIB67_021218 [Kingdonia uniflora]|uniref:C2H2-type domain-containing protein n=1 Tax=Kingdonia uniflora TaxID=39325 RepID=A0A7J7LFP6_9MAGN|nr:hypothetical protein GIB67_021218 [Kingdonia uniflora]
MAGRRKLGVSSTITAYEVRKLGDELTLRDVQNNGHIYVELREIGKRGLMFFCTLCHSQCHGDTVLHEHLNGKFHRKRLSYFQNTLLLPNPWPLNDGVLFFHRNSESVSNGNDNNGNANMNDGDQSLVVPGVLCYDEVMNLEVKLIGFGEIAARMDENYYLVPKIRRIWCSWLGKDNTNLPKLPEHDFAIVVFCYNYNIGRQGALHEFKEQLAEYESAQDAKKRKIAFSGSGDASESEQCDDVSLGDGSEQHDTSVGDESQQRDTSVGDEKRRKRALSGSEDVSESEQYDDVSLGDESEQYDTFVGDGDDLASNTLKKSAAERYEDKLRDAKLFLHRNDRRQLRKQQRLLSERMCDFCQHKILQGKDVATLLNMKTKRLVCNSRNHTGAFHILHVSCLIRWILICESKMLKKQTPFWEVTANRGLKNKSKKRKVEPYRKRIASIFCTECQGTGIEIEGDKVENAPYATSDEMFFLKVEAGDTHRAWVERSAEVLQNCSTGLTFHFDSDEEVQENVSRLKLLRFYRAYD